MFFFFLPLGVQDFWHNKSKYANLLLTCPRCLNKSVRVCRHWKTLSIIVLPILPVYTTKALRCSVCGWWEPSNKNLIEKKKQDEPRLQGARLQGFQGAQFPYPGMMIPQPASQPSNLNPSQQQLPSKPNQHEEQLPPYS
ncbi:hypothetical protein SPOG_01903 [Schizosaccharomyces cryophilus OY26]|uniref:Zinc-ribbon 15 domain-containing protein n=1 Tax=Schizosaccharomyces cryophilus (strain OY26 / ATCC MYA-4695 / CBS 11777 / NBRC 106824 / NRRL Y48691) TaxID=653667 RepID=S9X646_SCHCR|nr:uncharacterized protein SPOG_01903 [Schizosaccharomyces cryophilus OY26]EPY52582.1 hypothetical protein SPOG_01903 [Schizosaccharomyces cryophilus OY26]